MLLTRMPNAIQRIRLVPLGPMALLFAACGGATQSGSVGQGGTHGAGGSDGTVYDAEATGGSGGSRSDAGAQGGTGEDSSLPVDAATDDAAGPDASTNVVATPIAAAVTHACAVVDGAAYCWGENQFGELGNGTTTNSSLPVLVHGLSAGVQAVAAGSGLSCAIVNGATYCWGNSGVVDGAGSLVPIQVQGLGAGLQSIAAIGIAGYAIVDGAVYDWGSNFDISLAGPFQVSGLDSGVEELAGGSCAVIRRTAYCWGRNNYGQLGNGTLADSSAAVQVQGLTSGVTAIAAGYDHACAVMSGAAYCWGRNNEGQLGSQTDLSTSACPNVVPMGQTQDDCRPVPLQVQGLPSGAVTAISAGTYHTCAIVNGAAYCWGINAYGQLGDGSTHYSDLPVQVQGLTDVTAISANSYPQTPQWTDITCAVANGDVYCWGSNAYGQLGDGTTTDSAIPVKVEFPIDSDGG